MDREQFQQFMAMLEAIRLAVVATGEATMMTGGGSYVGKDSATISEFVADEALRPSGALVLIAETRRVKGR